MSIAPADLYVCVTCRPPGDPQARPGLALHQAMTSLLAGRSDIALHSVECLSVCTRPCTIAISAPGKWSYVIGGLDAANDAAALALYASQYSASADGIPSFKDRPQAIRKGAIARIPPRS